MDIIPVEEARRHLGELIQSAVHDRKPIVISKRGKDAAVLLSYQEYERLRRLDEEAATQRFLGALQAISQATEAAGLAPSVVEEALREIRRS